MKNSGILSILITGFLSVIITINVNAQDKWEVSDDAKALTNPLELTSSVIDNGEDAFQKNCVSCHGPAGEGKPIKLTPLPPDLGDEEYITANTDGEIFTKITEGRGPMPKFEKVLTEEVRWSIVGYLRTFGASTVVVDTKETAAAVTGDLSFKLDLNEDNHIVNAQLLSKNDSGEQEPAAGVKVSLFAKRTFGNLQLGEAKTNADGWVSFTYPHDLPRDRKNKTDVILRVSDSDTYGNVEKTEALEWGEANPHVNLLEKRSMWTVRWMAPLWLIISYHAAVAGFFLFLGHVVLQVLKIRKAD